MQLIAEAYDLLKSVYGLDAPAMAEIFQAWKQGDLDSYLIEITAAVLRKTDGDRQAAGRRHPRRGRAEGHRPLDGSKRARTRRAADRDHRGGLRPRPLRAPRDAAGDGEEDAAAGAADAEARKGGDRRDPRRSLRLQDRRLRAGFEQMSGASANTTGTSSSAISRPSGAAAASSAPVSSTVSRRPTTATPSSPTCCSTTISEKVS